MADYWGFIRLKVERPNQDFRNLTGPVTCLFEGQKL